MNFIAAYFADIAQTAAQLDQRWIESLVNDLIDLRKRGGRLFLVGVGGSAANCSHAVNDFRKLCRIEAYSPVDNVSELTARTNDEGWETVFAAWLSVSQANEDDALFVLSVGGGSVEHGVSPNLVMAIDEAKRRGLRVYGIVGPQGGYTKKMGDIVITVPVMRAEMTTPISEAFQAVVWHCLVSHPRLQCKAAKWESLHALTTAP